ncbi:MAG: hypothetical protein FJZ92_01400 [Chloroflexi bacterium]|nr:hypothetical protein [Chloroflexota bacterium]
MLAESYELNVAPHNFDSHLSRYIAPHLCATVPNVRIMEIDIGDVPWNDETHRRRAGVRRGDARDPEPPRRGIDLDARVARAHVRERGRGPGYVGRTR